MIADTFSGTGGSLDDYHSIGQLNDNQLCWSILLILFSIGITISTLCFKSREWIFVFFIDMFFLSCGGLTLSNYQLPQIPDKSVKSEYIVSLLTEPVERNNYFRAEAEILDCLDSVNISLRGEKVIINFYLDSSSYYIPHLSDIILIKGNVFLPAKNDVPNIFEYGDYLRHHGYCGIVYLNSSSYQYIGKNTSFNPRIILNSIRLYLVNRYRLLGIEDDNLSVLTAITLGDKSMLTSEQKSAFTAAGVQHILVVSGMHVGFIFAFIIFLLKRSRRKTIHHIVYTFGIVILWLYASITGLAPAVVRATIMFTIMLLFYIKGEYYSTYKALVIAAIISLIYNPYLIFDVGFILSYTAVLSISVFYPKFMGMYHKMHLTSKLIGYFVGVIVVTISAQVLTFPIITYVFNQFPVYFILTNIIASLFTPILFCGGFIAILSSYIPFISNIISAILIFLLSVFQKVVIIIADMPQSVINTHASIIEVVLLYALLLTFLNYVIMYRFQSKRFLSLVWLMSTICVAFIVSDFIYMKNINRDDMFILKNNKMCVNFVSTHYNVVCSYDDDTTFLSKQLLPLHLKYRTCKPYFITDTNLISNYFMYQDKSYLVLKDNIFRYKYNNGKQLKVDYLLIGRGIYPSPQLFDKFISPSTVYLMPGVWNGYIPLFEKILNERSIDCVEWGRN